MAEISRPHPRLPFITLTIDRPTDAEMDEAVVVSHEEGFCCLPSLSASADIENNYVIYPYKPGDEADDETIFAGLAHNVEVSFFREQGGFLHLRMKAEEAAAKGDLEMLCLLAEGFGYWRGATEAHNRAADYHARSLDPAARPHTPPEPLSFFAALADPPTILADYHEQRRKKSQPTQGEPEPNQGPDEDLPF
jgi:hypothetical protein